MERKTVLRAGTYVTGMSCSMSSIARFLGTSMSAVSADPPKGADVHIERDVFHHVEMPSDFRCALEFVLVSLPVSETQCVRRVALSGRDGESGRGVGAATQEHDRLLSSVAHLSLH